MFFTPLSGTIGNDFIMSQGFGGNAPRYRKYGLAGHNGIDLAVPIGTTLYAPHDGYLHAGNEGKTGYGMYVSIVSDPIDGDHHRERSDLAHLSAFLVPQGTFVHKGDPVALSGNSGDSTGPHVHWTFKKLDRDGNTLAKNNGFKGALSVANYTVPYLHDRLLAP